MEKLNRSNEAANRLFKSGFLFMVLAMVMMMSCTDKKELYLPSIAEIKNMCGHNRECVLEVLKDGKQRAEEFCETFNSDMQEFKKVASWKTDVKAAFDLPDDEEYRCGEDPKGPGYHRFYTKAK